MALPVEEVVSRIANVITLGLCSTQKAGNVPGGERYLWGFLAVAVVMGHADGEEHLLEPRLP